MQVVANVEGLKMAISAVSGAVPASSPKPILQNLLFRASETGCTILANNLEFAVLYHVPGVRVIISGDAVLPTKRLKDLLDKLTCPDIEITVDNGRIKVRSDKGKWNFNSEDPVAFPVIQNFDASNYLVISGEQLRHGIDRTIFATDVNSSRYALGGVLFDYAAESFRLVATDGRRLALQPLESPSQVGDVEAFKHVVPVKPLKVWQRLLDGGSAYVRFDESCMMARGEKYIFYARLLEGRFPRWEDVIPEKPRNVVTISAGGLFQATKQAAVTTSEESQGIDYRVANDAVTITSKSVDGSTEITTECRCSAAMSEARVTLANRLISDGLAVMAGEIEWAIGDGKAASLFSHCDGYQYVVMPLTKEA